MSGTAELLYGQRTAGTGSLAQTTLDTGAGETLVVEGAEILYVLHETPMSAARARLPVSLHPSIPALFGLSFVRARNSDIGPFEIAWLGIACRTGIKPRHFVEAAYTDSEAAAAWFGARYGFACARADVRLRETYDRVRGCIECDGRRVIDVAIADCIPLVGAGAMIKYSPPLNVARVGEAPTMVQFEAAYDFKRVLRGKPRLAVFEPGATLRPTHPIAGSFAVCDLHLMPARFQVDLTVPAESGGAQRIAR